jgi:hypothetical protein
MNGMRIDCAVICFCEHGNSVGSCFTYVGLAMIAAGMTDS